MPSLGAAVEGTRRVFLRGVPVVVSSSDLQDYLSKYGPVERVFFNQEQGFGFVDFQKATSAQQVAEDSGQLDSEGMPLLAIQGCKMEAKRAMPSPLSVAPAPAMQQALVEPAPSEGALDVVVIRGHASATGLGLAYMYAKAQVTTLVLWDRHQLKDSQDPVRTAVPLRQYATMEEEKPDGQVMGKAFEFFGVGSPKCALLHLGSDKVKQANSLENPLLDYEAVVRGMEDNHTETLQCFYAVSIYEPWIHAFRATAFILVPSTMNWDWPDDLSTCSVSSRRVIRCDPLRVPDGSGWTVGLQMCSESSAVNASLAFAAMNKIVLADDNFKHSLSGKNVQLDMPNSEHWMMTKSLTKDATAIGHE